MSDFNNMQMGNTSTAVDAGLRSFMLGVYNKMGLGLLLSAALAYATSSVPEVRNLIFTENGYTILGLILAFSPLCIVFTVGFFTSRMNSKTANIYYWTLVSLIGAGLGVILTFYSIGSIANAFLLSAAAFGGLSLYGYTTKKDLSGWRSALIMMVFGLVIGSLINFFIYKSPFMDLIFAFVGLLVFSGLVAYKTQYLKEIYFQIKDDNESLSVQTSLGALTLYISFINIFQSLLRILGNRN